MCRELGAARVDARDSPSSHGAGSTPPGNAAHSAREHQAVRGSALRGSHHGLLRGGDSSRDRQGWRLKPNGARTSCPPFMPAHEPCPLADAGRQAITRHGGGTCAQDRRTEQQGRRIGANCVSGALIAGDIPWLTKKRVFAPIGWPG